MAKERARAATTKIREGETSIDRAKVVARKDENGKVVEKRLAWTILLPGTAKPLRRFTQGGPRETDGMIRRRAREKAEQMLEEHPGTRGRSGSRRVTSRTSAKPRCVLRSPGTPSSRS